LLARFSDAVYIRDPAMTRLPIPTFRALDEAVERLGDVAKRLARTIEYRLDVGSR